MSQDDFRFIDDAHRKLVDLKNGLRAVSKDPYYAIDCFSEMGIREAPQYILNDVMKIFLDNLDKVKEFENFDVIVSASGVLKVCIKETREFLAVIDMNTKHYLVGTMTTNFPPDGLVDDLEQRRRSLRSAIESSKAVHKSLSQRVKDFVLGNSVKDCADELEVLDSLDSSIKKDYLQWTSEHKKIKAQIDMVNNTIVPMLQRYGYTPGQP